VSTTVFLPVQIPYFVVKRLAFVFAASKILKMNLKAFLRNPNGMSSGGMLFATFKPLNISRVAQCWHYPSLKGLIGIL
jgi:hypothetical protein